jgi:hypothetical protein
MTAGVTAAVRCVRAAGPVPYRTVFAVSVMRPSVPFRRPRLKKADTHGSHRAQDLFTPMPHML